MDKSTKQLLTRVSALQESVKEGKKLCLESAAIIKVQRDMIDELVETLGALLGEDEKLQVGIGGNPTYVDKFIEKAWTILDKAKELGYE